MNQTIQKSSIFIMDNTIPMPPDMINCFLREPNVITNHIPNLQGESTPKEEMPSPDVDGLTPSAMSFLVPSVDLLFFLYYAPPNSLIYPLRCVVCQPQAFGLMSIPSIAIK
nr:hypothetical protein Iba_chr03bCG14260 [Ipomoea batatas]